MCMKNCKMCGELVDTEKAVTCPKCNQMIEEA